MDGISLFLVLLSTLLTPICILASWKYIEKRVKEFLFCLLLIETACVGVFSALDFVLFYIFFEAMLVPMYLLIAVWGGPAKVYASIKFFIYTMAGSVFLLVAMIAFYVKTGTFSIPELMTHTYSFNFQFWVFLAMGIAFAIKVPMAPLHTWLPAAHVEAPTAGSVILASILLKMGTYGFVRFCLPILPQASVYFAPYVFWISIISIIYGGYVALGQSDMKRLIAYSSVAHMGFVTLGTFLFNKNRAGRGHPADDQSRNYHRGPLSLCGDHLRKKPQPIDYGQFRDQHHHAHLHRLFGSFQSFVHGLSGNQQFCGRTFGFNRHLCRLIN